jgi:hypothetical protein
MTAQESAAVSVRKTRVVGQDVGAGDVMAAVWVAITMFRKQTMHEVAQSLSPRFKKRQCLGQAYATYAETTAATRHTMLHCISAPHAT